MNEKDLVYSGQIADFPKEVVMAMLDEQERQGNPKDVRVFEECKEFVSSLGGFDWNETSDSLFWVEVITNKNFALFFERYPKELKVGDLVIAWDNKNQSIIGECTWIDSNDGFKRYYVGHFWYKNAIRFHSIEQYNKIKEGKV